VPPAVTAQTKSLKLAPASNAPAEPTRGNTQVAAQESTSSKLATFFQIDRRKISPLGASGRIANAELESLPSVTVGDTWTLRSADRFQRTSEESTIAITEVTPQRLAFTVDGKAGYALGQRWQWVSADGAPLEDFLRFPLTQNKSWKNTYETAANDGLTWLMEDTYTVLGEEQVTVPAGVFDAIVIQRIRYEQPKQAPVGFNLLSRWSITTTEWYAPKAKRTIKRETIAKGGVQEPTSRDSDVLVSYRVR
jgi:hypothetical protein